MAIIRLAEERGEAADDIVFGWTTSPAHTHAITSRVFNSSVGTKLLIGITGLALFLYLLIHIAGNLVVFFGPAAFNKYAFTLEGNPLLPVIEIGLLLVFLIHIYKTVTDVPGQPERAAGRATRRRSTPGTPAARRSPRRR